MIQANGIAIPGRLASTSLELESGTLTCVIGPNGSGKTSLLHALAGVGDPEGEVKIGGRGIRDAALADRSRMVGFLPASRDIRWPLGARDVVALGGAAASPELIDTLALDGLLDRRIDRLSTGERSRVLIARVLAAEPRLLLLDEPTANLDPLWQLRLMPIFAAHARKTGATALVAIHDLDLAAAAADRLLVMNRGEVAADGNPRAVLASGMIPAVFGIIRSNGVWTPA